MKAARKESAGSAAKKRARKPAIKYPSKASLREMPERARDAKLKPNKYAKKIREAGGGWFHVEGQPPKWIPSTQGRPRKGEPSETTKPRSVRLPDSVWEELQRRADARGVGVHTLLRELVAEYLGRAA